MGRGEYRGVQVDRGGKWVGANSGVCKWIWMEKGVCKWVGGDKRMFSEMNVI